MKNETKFYKILEKARTDEVSLILAVNKVMPLITKYSLNRHNEIDEDLRSELIEYAVSIVKTEDFANKLAKMKKI